MYKDPSSSSGSGASTKGDEVELVSRFLAPLCARDEAARNIALAAARTTVEGWLGGVGSPNQWEDSNEIENTNEESGKFKGQDGRYDMNIERSPRKMVPKLGDHRRNELLQHHYQQNPHAMQDAFKIEGFFPQSINDNVTTFACDSSLDSNDRFPSGSFDCVDGRLGNETTSFGTPKERWPRQSLTGEKIAEKLAHSISSDEGKGFNIEDRSRRFKENQTGEPRFSSSSESERKFFGYEPTSNDMFDDTYTEDSKQRFGKNLKIKGARQKQLEDDDLDSDTRIYGKSPKFDENLGNFGPYESAKAGNYLSRSEQYGASRFDRDVDRYDRRNLNVRGRRFYEYSDETSFEDDQSPRTNRNRDGIVFNTLEGFENDNMIAVCENAVFDRDDEDGRLENMNLENTNGVADENIQLDSKFGNDIQRGDNNVSLNQHHTSLSRVDPQKQDHYLRNTDDRKFSAGQIKRPLSQDEDVSSKSGRVLEGPEVTPGDVGRMLNLGNALDGPRQAQPNKYLSLVTLHLPVILRLSVNCPFQNVRIKCAEILLMVKDRGLPVPEAAFDGPSAFVPTSELPDLNSLDEKTHMLLMDAFLQNNRLDHVSRVMSSHPSYLEHFLRTQHFVLRGDGPLPYDYRHLIAIMAAGRHQCSYLINLQKGEFILQGGDALWLQGLRSIPDKLQNLYEINKILAHRPWLLNKTHIEKLTKGADNWSLAEVVHAIVLLAHFHSLSSFVFSCGINEELDNVTGHHYKENVQDNSNTVQPAKDKLISSPKKIPNCGGKTDTIPSPPSSPSIVGEQEVGVETLMERMKRLSEKSESYQITQEELSKRFETVETQSAELAAAPQRNSSVLDSDIGLFIEDPTFIYQDFAKRGQLNDIPTFRVQDYSWDDHGYSLVNRLYNDVGNLLDDKFKTAYNLTYYTMGTHNKVDTSRFRRAIWNYIHCMFGIRHDDYDYNEVNQLLERSLKTFIKSAVCYPERVTKRDYDRVMREFKHSEKVHVNLMILEARMQAELLYALRAVMRYMT